MAPAVAFLRLGLCCYLSLPSIRHQRRKQAKQTAGTLSQQLAPTESSSRPSDADDDALSVSSRILSWYSDASGDGGAARVPVELTHRAFVDPLPDIGDDGRTPVDVNGKTKVLPPTASADADTKSPTRLVRYATLAFPHHLPTKNRASKALKSGNLLLNSTPSVEGCRHLHPGDVLTLLTDPPPPPSDEDLIKRTNFVTHMLEVGGLSVAYEDDALAAVYKPAGVHTKRDTNYRYLSLEDAIPAVLKPPPLETVRDGLPLPLAVHRLDVRVCGLVLVAKSRRAMLGLGEQFERREVKKRYEALVVGRPGRTMGQALTTGRDEDGDDADAIVIDAPIQVEGRGTLPARTTLRVLSTTPHAHWGALSHVELLPETGRTHQLRVHCAGIGCPIVGDDLYWDYAIQARQNAAAASKQVEGRIEDLPPVRRGGGLYLQSTSATFAHPTTGEIMELEVPVADKFGRLLDKARKACEYDDDDGGVGNEGIAAAAAA